MRNNINKIIAFAIGLSVISGSIIPAFALDSTSGTSTTTAITTNDVAFDTAVGNTNIKSNILTLDDAINSAISISETLSLDEKKISYQDKYNDINKSKDDFNKVNDDQEQYDNDTGDAKLKQAQQQLDFDTDSLKQKVTDQYNNIVTSQMQIDMAAKNLEIENKSLEDTKFKQSLGMQTPIDIQTLALKIQKDQNTQNTSLYKLKDAEYTFNKLTGKDVTKYILEKDIKFEPFKIDGSIDEYLDNSIDIYLKYTEQLLNINKKYYNDQDYENTNGITEQDIDNAKKAAESATKPSAPADNTNLADYEKYQADMSSYNSTINKYTSLLGTRLTYLTTKLGNYSTEANIDDQKTKFKDQLRSYYTNLQTYTDNINYLKNQIQLINEQLSNAKTKFDLGMITETDYNTLVVSSEQSDIDLRNAIISYNQNVQYIQKPWIATSLGSTGSSSSGGSTTSSGSSSSSSKSS